MDIRQYGPDDDGVVPASLRHAVTERPRETLAQDQD